MRRELHTAKSERRACGELRQYGWEVEASPAETGAEHGSNLTLTLPWTSQNSYGSVGVSFSESARTSRDSFRVKL